MGSNCSSDENLKVKIKLDNHSQHSSSSDSPRNSLTTAGVKLTLKPLSEPPIPKFTITNAFNDTAKVVMLNNNEQTDESSDELPSQPPSNQPSPSGKTSTQNDYVTHTITSTSSSYSGTTAEDNLSTCSSSSASSYSSSSSQTHPNNDIRLIIKVILQAIGPFYSFKKISFSFKIFENNPNQLCIYFSQHQAEIVLLVRILHQLCEIHRHWENRQVHQKCLVAVKIMLLLQLAK